MLLHRNLAPLADVCDDCASVRYSLHGVRVEKTAAGYRAAATNGRILVVVDGPEATAAPYAGIAYPPAPVGRWALIPRKVFAAAFRMIRGRETVAVDLASCANRATIYSGVPENCVTRDVKALDGKFPDIAFVLPTTPPKFTCVLGAHLLADLAAALEAFASADYEHETVTVEFRAADQAIVFRMRTGHGQTVTALQMPKTENPLPPDRPYPPPAPPPLPPQ
jgi:DNA polymerase III sliding clamp (beta) subunit (PCNA family)